MKRRLVFVLLLTGLAVGQAPGPLRSKEELRLQADQWYAEGSYRKAAEAYRRLADEELSEAERRRLEFRWIDSDWRSENSSDFADDSFLHAARTRLESLLENAPRDDLWAALNRSLGDCWTEAYSDPDGRAWSHYQAALDYWAESPDLPRARREFLDLVVSLAARETGSFPNWLPTLEQALSIVQDSRQEAIIWFAMARHLAATYDPSQQRRAGTAFEKALAAGSGSLWTGEILYRYGQWLATAGKVALGPDGQWKTAPDYPKAVEIYQQLIQMEVGSESQRDFRTWARSEMNQIVKPALGLSTDRVFPPGSEVSFQLRRRNVRSVELRLFRIDLTHDLSAVSGLDRSDWLAGVRPSRNEPEETWSREFEDRGHEPVTELIRWRTPLAAGAYLVKARAGDVEAREALLVTDAALVLRAFPGQAILYFCDAVNGAPLGEADFALWGRSYEASDDGWSSIRRARTDAKGLALVEWSSTSRFGQLFATVSQGDRQALAWVQAPPDPPDPWRLHAFSDRPAYRPGERVRWKALLRQAIDGRLVTPAGKTLDYRIVSPLGDGVKESSFTLDSFGGAAGDLALTASMPLGLYQLEVTPPGENMRPVKVDLFHLEEYRLPEFKVEVSIGSGAPAKRVFRLGESVSAEVAAEYYFGGPVAGARVEMVVFERPYQVRFRSESIESWLGEPASSLWRGTVVRRDTLRLDSRGLAQYSFQPDFKNQDFEYVLEARVSDASRREIVGSGRARVSRQPYAAFVKPQRSLQRSGDPATVKLKTQDAFDQPVAARGAVTVTRKEWVETWIDPQGKEVAYSSLPGRIVRPTGEPVAPGDGWTLKFRGVATEEILSRRVSTDERGEGVLTFEPSRPGVYDVTWVSETDEDFPVQSVASIWVADAKTVDLGFRQGGVQIIVDRDRFRVGEKAVVLLTTPVNDRHVLLTVEGENRIHHELVHVKGTAQLLEVPLDEAAVPNLRLTAAMVDDLDMAFDAKELFVEPERNQLRVTVTFDRARYLPRQDSVVTVQTRDSDGNPVSAEVAIGVADEAVYDIEPELAPPPLQVFFPRRLLPQWTVSSSFSHKPYRGLAAGISQLNLIEGDRSRLMVLTAGGSGVAYSSLPMNGRMPGVEEVIVSSGGETPIQVRSDFAATAFWTPKLRTDAKGWGTATFRFPDSLTTWRATVRASDQGNRFGVQTSSAVTEQPLILRLQTPRFFQIGDQAVVSAIVNNKSEEAVQAVVDLEIEGLRLASSGTGPRAIRVESGAEGRVDWEVFVDQAGSARLTASVRSKDHSDAVQKSVPVYEHGIEKLLARSGKLTAPEIEIPLTLPPRKPGSTELAVQVTPSLAVTMLDALPYLADYPYGCTEQTLSRFVPAVVTARTLKRMGLSRQEVAAKIFGGVETEFADKTHTSERSGIGRLDEMIQAGLRRIYDFQLGDGGWGWWKNGQSDPFMSAYVVWALALAREAGVEIDEDVLENGVLFLDEEALDRETDLDLLAWELHALAFEDSRDGGVEVSRARRTAFEQLWMSRDQLNAYGRALLALTAHYFGERERALVLARNLENGVRWDRDPSRSVLAAPDDSTSQPATAHWGEDGIAWHWSGGGVEATAFALRALLAIEPGSPLVEPTVAWLLANRRGAQWSNTRDTAIVLYALNDYLEQSGGLQARAEFEVLVNGRSVGKGTVSPQTALRAPSRFDVDPGILRDGKNRILLRRNAGEGPLYFSAAARFHSLEEPIAPAGNSLFVQRRYYRLVPHPTLLRGTAFEPRPLLAGDALESGERVEVVAIIEAKNNLEYLIFEDLKPAGLEALERQSGYTLDARQLRSDALARPDDSETDRARYTGRREPVYRELRDRKLALFVSGLGQGFWEIRYQLRAETPGRFHALPLLGRAMYVPEISANGEETIVEVRR